MMNVQKLRGTGHVTVAWDLSTVTKITEHTFLMMYHQIHEEEVKLWPHEQRVFLGTGHT